MSETKEEETPMTFEELQQHVETNSNMLHELSKNSLELHNLVLALQTKLDTIESRLTTPMEPQGHREVEQQLQRGEGMGIDMKVAHQLYSDSLKNTRVTTVPDFKFKTAKLTWERLCRDIPLPQTSYRAMMALAFQGSALKVYERAAMETQWLRQSSYGLSLRERSATRVT